MSKEIKIETVKLKIAGQEIELTLDQAQSLKNVLEDLFPSPRLVPSPPLIIHEYRPRRVDWYETQPWKMPEVICKSNNTGTVAIEAR